MKLISLYKDGKLVFEGSCYNASRIANVCETTIYKKIGTKNHTIGQYEFKYKNVAQSTFNKTIENSKKVNPLESIIKHLKTYGNTNLVKDELKYLPELEKKFKLKIEHYAPSKYLSVCKDGDDYQSNEDWIISVEGLNENL